MTTRIGIIGGGQLARMMGEPARRLGFYVTVLDPTPESPAYGEVDEQVLGDYSDAAAVSALGQKSDVVTFEVEHTDWEALRSLSVQVHPTSETLETLVNKLKQKQLLQRLEVPTAPFYEVRESSDLLQAASEFGYPLMLKAAENAYDGRGNFLIENSGDIEPGLAKFSGQVLYVEKFVPFIKELAIMVARGMDGQISTFPVVETIHVNHICHTVLAPAPVDETVQQQATDFASTVIQNFEGAGVFGFEMFLTSDGQVLINEIAPRVHNSGHYTIEACRTSQFEQHIRAITGLPLGPTHMLVPAAVMVNILGDRTGPAQVDGITKAHKIPGVSVHIYGKKDTRPERKMGHITAVGATIDEALANAQAARKLIRI